MARSSTKPKASTTGRKRARGEGDSPAFKPPAGGFSQLINRAIRTGRLTAAGPAAQRLYSYLTYFAEPRQDFRLQVGVATLARVVGMARPTVRNGLDALAKHGLLSVDQPATTGPDGQGIPAVYRLLVPEEAETSFAATANTLASGAPAPWQATDQQGDQPLTGTPDSSAPGSGRATDHKQNRKPKHNKRRPQATSSPKRSKSDKLSETVLLLQEQGVDDAAAVELASKDPLVVRAVILTAMDKPGVRDTTAYIVKFLRMGWKPSPKYLAKAKAQRDAPAAEKRREADRSARRLQSRMDEVDVEAERQMVDETLAGLTDEDLQLLFDEVLEQAAGLGRIYRRVGRDHPATRAAMANRLTAAQS